MIWKQILSTRCNRILGFSLDLCRVPTLTLHKFTYEYHTFMIHAQNFVGFYAYGKLIKLRARGLLDVILIVMLLSTNIGYAVTPLKSGAELGKWSMDLEAAIELAETHKFPLFLNFTGSDWCGWCKIMEKKIFSNDGWSKFASKNLSLVTIDFPQDTTIVPQQFKQRNYELQEQFGVRGYPTYLIVESDGKTELGRLGASPGKDIEGFKKDILKIVKNSQGFIQKFSNTLPPAKANEFKNLVAQLSKTKAEFEEWLESKPQESEENFAKFSQTMSKITNLTIKIETIESEQFAKSLSAERAKEYLAVSSQLNETRIELDQWLLLRPKANEVNRKKMEELETRIKDLSDQANQFK